DDRSGVPPVAGQQPHSRDGEHERRVGDAGGVRLVVHLQILQCEQRARGLGTSSLTLMARRRRFYSTFLAVRASSHQSAGPPLSSGEGRAVDGYSWTYTRRVYLRWLKRSR